jgi:glycosyltransferase involved in cell wall biosynthesis
MIGPLADSGGVAIHTAALIREMERAGNSVSTYSTMTDLGWRPGRRDVRTLVDHVAKVGRILFGMPASIIANRRSDVVHIQCSGGVGGFVPAILGTAWGRALGKRVIVTFHYSKTEEFARKHGRLLSFVAGRSSGLILVSDRQRQAIAPVLGKNDRSKIHVIPNGFDPERMRRMPKDEARRLLGIDDGCPVATNIAWVMEKKGHARLLEAVERLVAKGGRIKVFVIGKGPLLESMRAEVRTKGLAGSIEFKGFVPDDQLALYMSASDFFVLSSYEEGNPLVMFEALGMGLPFIGTDVGGIPEIIRSREHGILVRPHDSIALSFALEEASRRRWDNASIADYGRNFSWGRIAQRTMELYRT